MTSTVQMSAEARQRSRAASSGALRGPRPFRVFPIHPKGRTKSDRRHIKPGFISTYCSDITIDLVHPYHRCSTNYPYERSCPLSPALSPTSNDSVRFFPGNMRYAESHISSSSLVRDMYFGFVRVSGSASLPIQSVPSPDRS